MKRLAVSLILTVAVAVAFIIGITSQAPALLIPAFCLWTPVAWFAGYALAKSGIHISIKTGVQQPARRPNGAAIRPHKISETEYSS